MKVIKYLKVLTKRILVLFAFALLGILAMFHLWGWFFFGTDFFERQIEKLFKWIFKN